MTFRAFLRRLWRNARTARGWSRPVTPDSMLLMSHMLNHEDPNAREAARKIIANEDE